VQQPREVQRDLTVSACNRDAHARKRTRRASRPTGTMSWSPATKETTMPVGKAKASSKDKADPNFQFIAPCTPDLDEAWIKDHLERDHFFWLDLTSPSHEKLKKLQELFGFHPLALEDSEEFRQRPKLDNYGDYVFMVFYGARGDHPEDPLREVHLFISGKYVITIHRDPLPPLDEQREQLDGQMLHSEQFLIYRVLDALTDSFFPMLSDIDDEIDQLEDAVLAHPTDRELQRLFGLKRTLVAMRKVVTPQRDIFARSIDQIADLPGLQLDERDYFRDIYDHLIRISDLIDSYRDLLSGATDLYLSTISNRQNDVMKQLTIIATIFLPLSFITGFFGQNFAYMVTDLIKTEWVFWIVGVGSMVATAVCLLIYFRRKGWV
jgi:magnesium transporter